MKFDYNDKVTGFIDGFPMVTGYVVVIDPDSEWPYTIRCDDEYFSFAEDELVTLP